MRGRIGGGKGLVVLEVRPLVAKAAAEGPSAKWFTQRVSPVLFISAVRDLSTLLGVGIPLTESLDVLLQQYTGPLRTALLKTARE